MRGIKISQGRQKEQIKYFYFMLCNLDIKPKPNIMFHNISRNYKAYLHILIQIRSDDKLKPVVSFYMANCKPIKVIYKGLYINDVMQIWGCLNPSPPFFVTKITFCLSPPPPFVMQSHFMLDPPSKSC